MKLEMLRIHNYKSLRNVRFWASPFSCIVGPNAAGKSNFADALHFLSEVYTHGLEVAIARKGGFENIAYRHARRSKAPIEFEVMITGDLDEVWAQVFPDEQPARSGLEYELAFMHAFAFNAVGGAIKADFEVVRDSLAIRYRRIGSKPYRRLYTMELEPLDDGDRQLRLNPGKRVPREPLLAQDARALAYVTEFLAETDAIGLRTSRQSLSSSELPVPLRVLSAFTRYMSRFQVYRLTPELSRSPGVPTPNPKLGMFGENLPALVDWLRDRWPDRWGQVMAGMQDVMPTLTDIHTQYLHTKTLGLVFEEEGVGRGWPAHDVSDGTIQALAILVASADPRGSVLLIEELENSFHPWVVRAMIERLRELSNQRTVVLSTHSPIIVDMFRPREVWVASRPEGETHIEKLIYLVEDLERNWLAGKFKISDYLDSGLLPQAVPGA